MAKAASSKNPVKDKQSQVTKIGNLSFSMEEKVCFGFLLLLIFLVITIRTRFNMIPFERDEGIYGYIGKLLLDGKIPYQDFQEQKFPGLFYFYAFMVGVFGDTVKGLHTGFMYLNIVTLLLLYFTSRKLFSPIAGLISAITFAFVSLTPNLSGFTVQAEHGVAFFISLGLFFYSYYNATNKWYYNFFMGMSFGMAFMTKTSGVFLGLWGGLALFVGFLFTKEKKIKDFIIEAGIYIGAVFSVIGFFFLIILMKGSFADMMFWAYEIPKNYVGKIPYEDGVKYFNYAKDAIVQNHKYLWVHGVLAAGVLFIKPISWKMKITALLLFFFSFCTIVPGYYFYGHYWIQTIPGLAILSGLTYYGIMMLIQTTFKFNNVKTKYVYLAIFIIFTFKHVDALKSYYFHPNYERILRSVYGSNPFPESMEIGNYINANSKPEDDIVVIGSEPQIYFYTHKKCASRFAYFATLVDDVPQHKQWQRDFIADVEKQKPRYVIFFNHAISLFRQPNTDGYIFEWLNKYTQENFQIIGLVDMVDGQQSTYLWKEAMDGYQPKGQNSIYIYERKPEPTPVQP
jgi:hypothetical protein